MLTVTGEVRKVIPQEYTNKKTGEVLSRALVILEPDDSKYNYEVQLTTKQCQEGVIEEWQQAKGKVVSVPVKLYVNYEYRFSKFTAVDRGVPQVTTPGKRQGKAT